MNKNEEILKLLLLMAFADKVFMAEEKELINNISKELGLEIQIANKIFLEIGIRNLIYECICMYMYVYVHIYM